MSVGLLIVYRAPFLWLHTERGYHILWVVATNHKQPVRGPQEVKCREIYAGSGKGGKQFRPYI